jgi:DNA modification methylase
MRKSGKTKERPQVQPEVKRFKLSELKPAKYNPRTISDDALQGLAESIKRFGCVEPIIINTRGGKNTIIGGNQRFKILQATGVKEAICITVDLNEANEKVLNITLNNPYCQSRFIKSLGEYIDKLRAELGNDKDYLALRIDELHSSVGVGEKQGLTCDDEIPKPSKKTRTKTGDLWLLDKHRLLCGNSTNERDVRYLMAGKKADLFATDPPYCVDYTGANRPTKKQGHDWSNTYHEIDIKNAKKFMKEFYMVGLKFIQKKTALYLWHASSRRHLIEEVCNELGILIHQQIIWVKPCAVITFSYYVWQHEPCLLMWVKGDKPKLRPRDMTIGSVWYVGYQREGDPTEPKYYTDVWELDWEGKKRNSGLEHPTVKPVEVFAIPMRVHTRIGDICYEPFCGSGSQIIAAEKLERRCFAMEIEPVFCDVAVKRWEQWSGKKAKLIRK